MDKVIERADMATAGKVSGAGAVSPRKLAHVVLRTRSNYREMISWYSTVLGARLVFDAGAMAFLSYDDEHHRIAIMTMPHLTDRPGWAIGLDHIAFTYADLAGLLSTYARLKEAGIRPLVSMNHGPTTSLYYRDPDRNKIELQIDNFADMKDATRYMEQTFTANPVGVEINPDEMLAKLRAGVPAEELVRPSQTPGPPSPTLFAAVHEAW